MLSAVTISGRDVPLANVEYRVTIQTGSAAIWEIPQPTTCQVAIWSKDIVPAHIGDELTLMNDDLPADKARFRGQITNVQLDHPEPGIARALITAQGPMMRLGRMTVAYSTLPEQTAAERLVDLFAMAGVVAQVKDPGLSFVMVERPLDNQKGRFMLEETVRGEPFDIWEMNIPLQLRAGITFDKAQFGNSDPASEATAVFLDQSSPTDYALELWGEINRSDTNLQTLPADAIAWEPRWQQDTGRVVNQIAVEYGPYPTDASARPTIAVESAPSIATFGPASTTIKTDIKDAQDAGGLAVKLLSSYAQPMWELSSCDLLLHEVDELTRRQLLGLIRPGLAVRVDDLPQPAPATYSDFWVEGFTEAYAPGQHIMTLALTAIPTGPRFDHLRFDDADPTSPSTAVFNY
jgi:hypothetical protein